MTKIFVSVLATLTVSASWADCNPELWKIIKKGKEYELVSKTMTVPIRPEGLEPVFKGAVKAPKKNLCILLYVASNVVTDVHTGIETRGVVVDVKKNIVYGEGPYEIQILSRKEAGPQSQAPMRADWQWGDDKITIPSPANCNDDKWEIPIK